MSKSEQRGKLLAGKYELIKRVGRGGMASVWQAKARGAAGFERFVAIKRILPALAANTEFINMFVEEARVGSSVHHPHVVQIYDFGLDKGGRYFLVMEWVDGMDFNTYLKSFDDEYTVGAPWPIIVAICIEALRGLSAAHEREAGSVIHRDVNPANILLGIDGIAKLTDFGLARAMDRARMTKADVVKGKLAYLAPEITRGSNASVASDIFGMGIVLWEALSGERLFEAKTDLDVMIKVRNCEVPNLREFRPDLPKPLLSAIHRALAADPAERYETAHLMARSLAGILRGVTHDTHSKIIAESVRQARLRLAQRPDGGENA